MKTKVLPHALLMFLAMAMNAMDAQSQKLTVSNTQNSGCLSKAAAYNYGENKPISTIILEKEGNILSVQLLNYESNCFTFDFSVSSNIHEGSDGSPCSVVVKVAPVNDEMLMADCICPFNVSFTVSDLEPNVFYLDCWWYKGLVNLTEGEPLVLEDIYEDVTIDGLNYTLRKALHRAMVKKNKWTGELRIPAELNYEGQTYTVTGIYGDALRDNTSMTKVIIPSTISYIGFDKDGYGYFQNPFIGCTALESFEVEEENPILCAVNGILYNKEKTKLYIHPSAAKRTSFTVPEGVTKVAGMAFSYNPYLVSVIIPDEVTSLEYSTFFGCTNLKEVRLPSNLQFLGGWTFGNCSSLKTVTIPQSVTFLGIRLFSGCTSLTSVTMPESVTSTDYAIFENCTSLKNVNLSPNLEGINHQLFANCSSLKEIHIPEGVTDVSTNAFQNCTALKTVDLPESVHRLGDSPFSGCKLDSLLIRGIIDSRWINDRVFTGMGTRTKVYVQPTEVVKFKKVYDGMVYSLPNETNGISDNIVLPGNSPALFDLQGRQLSDKPAKGVYIQGGKKHVVSIGH